MDTLHSLDFNNLRQRFSNGSLLKLKLRIYRKKVNFIKNVFTAGQLIFESPYVEGLKILFLLNYVISKFLFTARGRPCFATLAETNDGQPVENQSGLSGKPRSTSGTAIGSLLSDFEKRN